MKENKGYVGNVSNKGAQVIQPPMPQNGTTKGGHVVRGNDLRGGREKK